MFQTRYSTLALTLMVSLSASAVDGQSIRADLASDNVVNKKFTVQDTDMDFYIHHRKDVKKKFTSNPEYFYFWHGDHQTAYPFMNLTTILSNNNTLNKRGAISMALDAPDGRWNSENNMPLVVADSIGKQYRHETGYRNEVSVGYDTGVAPAYRFACENKKNIVVAVAGGLYENESCEAKNMSVLFTMNQGDLIFPYDKDSSFTAGERLGLTERRDGKRTIDALKGLLNCSSVVESEARMSTTYSYSCENDNQLFVVMGNSALHQWNGYSNVSDGAFGMQGKPQKPAVTHWLYSEFGVK
ncbi:hypothetical protein [Vibrio crassostreae]|uniref:hypothetical protein n=1 Tax=Vibrio crassostreae TaxID=246167 RepID=UPI001B31243A|nr:hypothetical protein [Vibrio crassostreae]